MLYLLYKTDTQNPWEMPHSKQTRWAFVLGFCLVFKDTYELTP